LAQRVASRGLKKILTAKYAKETRRRKEKTRPRIARILADKTFDLVFDLVLLSSWFIRVDPRKSAAAFAFGLLAQDCSSYIEVVTEES
jgi:hypothetical protein